MDVSVRWMAIAVTLTCLCAGCQTTDPSIELLESELRWMEDQLYSLDQQLDQTALQLASCQRNNSSLRRELSDLKRHDGSAAAGGSPSRASRGSSGLVPPPAAVPEASDYQDGDLEVPRVELGPDESGLGPDGSGPSASPPPQIDPSSGELDDQASVNVHVSRIVLNSRLTGGYDFDGNPGDEGLLVVVEPQNSAGQYVPLPGDLTVEVTDPQQSGLSGRLAVWEFDASDTAPHLKKTLLGRGIHLQLPWPNLPPESDKLRVKVTYRDPTGRMLTARREINVDLIADEIPRAPRTRQTVMTDEFVPRRGTHPSQLLTERSLTPPSAPVTLVPGNGDPAWQLDSPPPSPSMAGRRPVRAANNSPPLWQPHR